MKTNLIVVSTLFVFSFVPLAVADDAAAEAAPNQDARNKKFEETLSGVKLVGRFTVVGKANDAMPEEEYTINSVKKLPEGDDWLFNARIKYGKYDVTVPLKLQVKWSDDATPVITLTDFTIPLLGTFSSRVVIFNGKYAGTWTHGKVGGHLFGRIVKLDETKKPSAGGDDTKQ